MCFSPEVSFAASAVLTSIGVACLRQTVRNNQLLFALTPFGFAFQQFCEGMIWLSSFLTHFPFSLIPFFKWGYILFAFVIWPIWIPLSIFLMEKIPSRRNIISIFVFFGAVVAIYDLFSASFIIQFSNGSIQYSSRTPYLWELMIYAFAAGTPFFISSVRFCWLIGIVAWILLFIVYYLQKHNFVSVWCVCCAIISVFVFFVLYKSKKH